MHTEFVPSLRLHHRILQACEEFVQHETTGCYFVCVFHPLADNSVQTATICLPLYTETLNQDGMCFLGQKRNNYRDYVFGNVFGHIFWMLRLINNNNRKTKHSDKKKKKKRRSIRIWGSGILNETK